MFCKHMFLFTVLKDGISYKVKNRPSYDNGGESFSAARHAYSFTSSS